MFYSTVNVGDILHCIMHVKHHQFTCATLLKCRDKQFRWPLLVKVTSWLIFVCGNAIILVAIRSNW